mgnify:CR=1 FL=1
MNVVQEKVDKLNAILKVQINSDDYQSKVKNTLEKYRKTAKVPGFRPGHVPLGMIQKQYGKTVLAEELNKISNDGLYKFIQDEKLEILGNPIPVQDDTFKGDLDNPADFEFSYEIGFCLRSNSVVNPTVYEPMSSGIGFFPHEPPQLPAQPIADSPGSSIIS